MSKPEEMADQKIEHLTVEASEQEGKFLVPAKALIAMTERMAKLETFVSRRFDEISMEINATSQQMDYTEEGMNEKFGEILEIINAVNFEGSGETAANTGVELSAVLSVTENAANTILDATENIAQTIQSYSDTLGEETVQSIQTDIQNIMMACEFQDLTGQRIQRAVDNLNSIEDRLSSALDNMGMNVDDVKKRAGQAPTTQAGEDVQATISSQDDIDALFD